MSASTGYLSWSRNAAICAGIAATVRIIDSQGASPFPTAGSESIITGEASLSLPCCSLSRKKSSFIRPSQKMSRLETGPVHIYKHAYTSTHPSTVIQGYYMFLLLTCSVSFRELHDFVSSVLSLPPSPGSDCYVSFVLKWLGLYTLLVSAWGE